MANSGNFNTNKYSTQYNGTIGLNLSWSITSQSSADNTSTIHWVLKSNGSMSSGYYVKGGPITVTIGGVTVLNITSRINVNGSGGFSRNGNITITHDGNGDKSVSMSVRAALYSSAVNCTGSKTYALDHIDRYALIESATDFTDEGNPTVVYSNPAGSDITSDIYVRLKWMEAGIERTTNWSSQLNDDGGTYTFDLTDSRVQLQQASWDTNTLPVTVDLKSTMNGVEYHDTKAITMSIVNANPAGFSISYQEGNSNVEAITQDLHTIVQNQSTLYIYTSWLEAKKYAQISEVWLNFNGSDYEMYFDSSNRTADYDIVRPNYSGTFTATVTVVDSRGNKTTATQDITITSWAPPTAQCTLARVNGFETNTVLTVNATYSSVPGNQLEILAYHRPVNGTWILPPTTVTNNTPVTLTLDNTQEWEVKVVIDDSFTQLPPYPEATYTLTVGKGIPIMFIDTDMGSVGIHGFPDANNQLYVGGDVKITGDLDLQGHLSLEGLKVRLHSVGPRTVSATSDAGGGNAYYQEFTEDITSLGFNNVYYVFGSCSRTTGTNMSMISIESYTATAINYAIYRQTSMTIADHMTWFLIIGD